MRFALNDEQQELKRAAAGFLGEHASSERVRAAMDSDARCDEDLWKRLGAEMGWPAVVIPEEYGGLGLGHVELAVLMEEMGAALVCAPFFSTVCLAAQCLLEAGDESQKQAHLPGIAAGETIATLALTEAGGGWSADAVQATYAREGSEFVLSGTKRYVPDGHLADLLIVAARAQGSSGGEGIALFLVPRDAPGVDVEALPTMDQTRPQAQVSLDGVRVSAEACMCPDGEAWPAIERALVLASVALAAEQVGGAERCLTMAVEYVKEREQFGTVIGRFQAVKHKCADMLLLVESARSAAYYAAWCASTGHEDLAESASIAKAYCSDAYFQCAADCLQLHGGVGFTWEYDVHLHFKRAKASETLLGHPDAHRGARRDADRPVAQR